MNKKEETVIMNFSGIYKEQQFFRSNEFENEKISWVEAQELTGCNCYCDEDAQNRIREMLNKYTGKGIHFIDSGNYHYVSRLWIEKISEPFRLVIFDNHTDMQLPAFGGLLSCGGWIAAALEELPFLQEVVLVGPDEEAYSQVEKEFQKKVKFLSREELNRTTDEEKNLFFTELPADLPVYVSVDKDVLSAEDAVTSWSQGDMRLHELLKFIEILLKGQNVYGMDICGECDLKADADPVRNDRANADLLHIWQSYDRESRI